MSSPQPHKLTPPGVDLPEINHEMAVDALFVLLYEYIENMGAGYSLTTVPPTGAPRISRGFFNKPGRHQFEILMQRQAPGAPKNPAVFNYRDSWFEVSDEGDDATQHFATVINNEQDGDPVDQANAEFERLVRYYKL